MKDRFSETFFIRYILIVYYLYLMSVEVIIPKKSVIGIVLNILIFIFIIYLNLYNIKNCRKFIIVYLYLLFCLILILSQSSDLIYSLTNYIKYSIGLLCLPVGFGIFSSLHKLKQFQVTGLTCLALYSVNIMFANLFHWGNTKGAYSEDGLEVGNLFSDALYLNVYVIVSIFFLIILFQQRKTIVIVLCSLCSLLIIVNMKRTVIGVLFVGLILYLIFYYIKSGINTRLSVVHSKIIGIFLGLCIIILPFFYTYIEINFEARQNSFENASEDIMNEGRMAELVFIAEDILDSEKITTLLFGKETFNLVGTYAGGKFGTRQIHGDYSILLNGIGVIGLILWFSIILFLLTWMLKLKEKFNHKDGIIASVLFPLYFTFIILYCISMGSGVLICVLSSSYFYASIGGMLRYFYNRNQYIETMKTKHQLKYK